MNPEEFAATIGATVNEKRQVAFACPTCGGMALALVLGDRLFAMCKAGCGILDPEKVAREAVAAPVARNGAQSVEPEVLARDPQEEEDPQTADSTIEEAEVIESGCRAGVPDDTRRSDQRGCARAKPALPVRQ